MLPAVARAADRFRAEVAARDAKALSEVTRAYASAWAAVRAEGERYARSMAEEARRLGVPLDEVARANPSWPYQAGRLQGFADEVAREILAAGGHAGQAIRGGAQTAGEMGAAHAEALARAGILHGLPAHLAARAERAFGASWQRVNLAALRSLAGALAPGSPVADLLSRYGGIGSARAREALLRGFVLGSGPRAIARDLRGATGEALWRALRLARTEVMRAYRDASGASYQSNPGIVTGWIWSCDLSPRTCGACLAMDGSRHDAAEALESHPNCRCAMVPATASYADLALTLGLPELSSVPEAVPEAAPRGEAWLAAQSAATAEAILGPGRARLWRAGMPLDQMVVRTMDPTWGGGLGLAPLRDLAARAAA